MNYLEQLRELLPEFRITPATAKSPFPMTEPSTCFVMSQFGFNTGHWIPNRIINKETAQSLREDFYVQMQNYELDHGPDGNIHSETIQKLI